MTSLNSSKIHKQELRATSLKHKAFIVFAFAMFGLLFECVNSTTSDEMDDAQKLTALQKVTVGYDSAAVTPSFPFRLDSVPSITDIHGKDSAKYRDLSQYSFNFGIFLSADNKKSGAKDAAIQGLECKEIFDTISSQPIPLSSDAKDLPANQTTPIPLAKTFTLASHKAVGKYIITQFVDGNPLKITTQPTFLYKFGKLEGSQKLLEITSLAPTRLNAESKVFLKALLDAKVFD